MPSYLVNPVFESVSDRSVRKYRGDPVPLELVREVIDAATYAPSARRGEQWRFTVLSGEEKTRFIGFFRGELNKIAAERGYQALGSALNSCEIMDQAPISIVVWNAGERGWLTEEHSVAAAMQNMLLRATDLGLGSLWIGDVYSVYEGIRAYFKKHWKLSGAIALGYPAEAGRDFRRKTVDEVTEWMMKN